MRREFGEETGRNESLGSSARHKNYARFAPSFMPDCTILTQGEECKLQHFPNYMFLCPIDSIVFHCLYFQSAYVSITV